MLSRVLTVLVLGLWFGLLGPRALGGPATYVIVAGHSMEPTLDSGDLVIATRRASYQPGDVVAFRIPEGQLVIHRIVGGSPEAFIVQGDNRSEADDWRPAAEDIAGKMWLRVPGAGRLVLQLRHPAMLAGLTAGLAMIVLGGEPPTAASSARGRSGRRASRARAKQASQCGYDLAMVLLAALGLCCLLFVALAAYSYSRPLQSVQTAQVTRYIHTGSFDYAVEVSPSELYAGTRLGPAELAGSVPQDGQGAVVLASVARSLHLDFEYVLDGVEPAAVSGRIGGQAVIRTDEGWSKTVVSVPEQSFEGNRAHLAMDIDLGQVTTLIDVIREQTGYSPRTYEIVCLPRIHIEGEMGGQPIDDSYAPEFVIQVGYDQLRLDPNMEREEPRIETVEQVEPGVLFSLGGRAISVSKARAIGLWGAVATGLGTVALGGWLGHKLSHSPAARIAARYGKLLIAVDDVDMAAGRHIRVRRISDLARVAKQAGQPILYQDRGEEHHYLVADGENLYEYTIPVTPEEH